MPNSTIPKISRRRRSSSSSHDGGDRTTTIVELLFSTNLIHLLFFPCRTEIVASRREILSPVFFLLRKQEETSFSLSEKKKENYAFVLHQRTVSTRSPVSSDFLVGRSFSENAIERMTMCVIQSVPQFLDVSPTYRAEGGWSERVGKKRMGRVAGQATGGFRSMHPFARLPTRVRRPAPSPDVIPAP